MDQRTKTIFFALIRSAILDQRLTDEERDNYSREILQPIIDLSKKHDISQILIYALKENGLLLEEDRELEKQIFTAVCRCERLKFALNIVADAFEKAEIPFLPLKGSVLRDYYRKPWMRTSCDIDVLVKEDDLDKAIESLCNKGFVRGVKSTHDVTMHTPSKEHLELHFHLMEDGVANHSYDVLADVWDSLKLKEGKSYFYEMPNELFYFYHVAHMAKHFENGGCGIRTILDLYILDKMDGCDRAKLDTLLEKGKLLKFRDAVLSLLCVWFGEERHNSITEALEDYLVCGGMYGNFENRIAVKQIKKGGRFKYIISRIFLPYNRLRFYYPIINKYPILTPIMHVRRWYKALVNRRFKSVVNEFARSNKIDACKDEKTINLLENLGLK